MSGQNPRTPAWVRLAAALATLWMVLCAAPEALGVQDPELKWRTIETAHFRVNYYEGLEPVALRVAAAAETSHERLTSILDITPKGRTEITLTDETDFANGWATNVPYRHIHVYVTAPADMSTLQDYDDWYLGLVMHEYAHVLHFETYGGIASVINHIFGKVYPPNSIQPAWIYEGLATLMESTETSQGGRLNSSQWEMMMRTAVLEDHFEPVDVIAIGPLAWPHGTTYYLYGSWFMKYVTDTYGMDVMRQMSHDYGKALLPFGINRTIREITGKTWLELYEEWFQAARQEYLAVAEEVTGRGIRKGMQITFTGEVDRSPRFSPDGRTLAYHSHDGHDRASILTLDMQGPLEALNAWQGQHTDPPPGSGKKWAPGRVLETTGQGAVAWTPDGQGLVFARSEIFQNWYAYHDLFWVDLQEQSILRLTEGGRCRQPDVSSGGDLMAYTVNQAGRSVLAVAPAGPDPVPVITHEVGTFGQVYSPRFSPDGTKVAYSAWMEGGLRDVQVLDVATGEVHPITSDRFHDTGPAWDPSGRYLYFSSDRTGIANIYALDLTDDTLYMVTNLVSGAFEPEISPDGRTLVYVGYHAGGYDLYAMRLDPTSWPEAPAPAQGKQEADLGWLAKEAQLQEQVQPKLYNPLRTLLPRSWMFTIAEDGFGQALSIYTTSMDTAAHHSIGAAVNVGLQGRGRFGYSLDYSLLMLPFDITLHHARTISPRWGLRIDDQWKTWPELRYSGSVSLSVPVIRADWAQYFTLTYRFAWMQSDEPLRVPMDPNAALPHLPDRGWLSGPTLSWYFTNAFGSVYGISAEEGVRLWASLHADLPALGSDYTAITVNYGITGYIEMPWLKHHVLALRLAGGYAWSDFQRRGYFSVGGFPRQDMLMDLVNQIRWSGVALRGYPPGVRWGDQYYLLNVEYRLPIVNIFRGLATIPWQFDRIFLSVLSDTGAAMPRRKASFDDVLTSVGAEVHLTMTLGYHEGVIFKVGYARGLMDGGINDFYVILGTPF